MYLALLPILAILWSGCYGPLIACSIDQRNLHLSVMVRNNSLLTLLACRSPFDLISVGLTRGSVPMKVSRHLSYLLALLMLIPTVSLGQPSGPQSGSPNNEVPLTVEEVVRFSQAGLGEELIVTKIKKNGKAFDLNAEELVDLRKQGVSDTVIKFLLDPSQPYVPPPPLTPPPPGKHFPSDTYAPNVPLEQGLYRFSGDVPEKVETRMLLGEKQGGGLMKKKSTVGYLIGSAAKTRIKESSPIFYFRLPEGKAIEEVVLVTLEPKGDRREIPLGSDPKKEDLKPDAVRQFDALEVGPRLFRITTNNLMPGEYLFFLVGSSEPAKGNYGKGYDFGVEKQPAGGAKKQKAEKRQLCGNHYLRSA